MRKPLHAAWAVLAAIGLGTASAHASVVIGGTRVIFPASQGEATVRLSNDGSRPALVEAWIDTGELDSTPDSVATPFLITPPLFRMEPHKDQSLRIIFTQGSKPLPSDRESLFWLNVLEVPPKPAGKLADSNTLQFAVRSRIKLFYRPADLPGDSIKAPQALTWTAVADGRQVDLVAHNPTPYYITISKLSLDVGGKVLEVRTGMVAPFSDLQRSVAGLSRAPSIGTAVAFTTIDDFGSASTHQGTIAR
jgi:chaperone protein EcpD